MDTEGPISVLDRRPRSSSRDRVISDRITRRKSPGPSGSRSDRTGSRSSLYSGTGSSIAGNEDDDNSDVVYRISQPYRTSFSAKHSVMWGKAADRSRSLSPTRSDISDTTSILSVQSAITGNLRRPRNRSKSPKRVTYDRRVTVRHSDTEDSMFTELSSNDYGDDSPMRPISNPFSRSAISPRYNEFSRISQQRHHNSPPSPSSPPYQQQIHMQPQHFHIPQQTGNKMKARYRDHRTMARDMNNAKRWSNDTSSSVASRDSGCDYSSEIKDLSNQITKMDWSPRQPRALRSLPPPISSPTHQRPPVAGSHQHYHHRRSSSSSSNNTNSSAPVAGILKESQNSRTSPLDTRTGNITHGNGSINDGSSNTSPSISSGASFSPRRHRINPALNPTEGGGKENENIGSPTNRNNNHHQHNQQQQPQQHHHPHQLPLTLPPEHHNQPQPDDDKESSSREDAGIGIEQNLPIDSMDDSRDSNEGSNHMRDPSRVRYSHAGDDSSPGGSTGGTSPGRGSPVESGRLTPSKRSFSLSITNFLRRFSPHLRRKKSGRDKGSKSSSAAGSAQSLEAGHGNHFERTSSSDRDLERSDRPSDSDEAPGQFKRNSVRQSLMKLMGRKSRSGSRPRSKKKSKGGKQNGTNGDPMIIPTPSHYTIELQDPDRTLSSDEVDEIINTVIINNSNQNNSPTNISNSSNGKPAFNASTSRIMKSIEDNKTNEKDIYKKFKERNSPKSQQECNNLHSSTPLITSTPNHHYNYQYSSTTTETDSSDNAAWSKSRPRPHSAATASSNPTAKNSNNNNNHHHHNNTYHRYSTPSISTSDQNVSMEFFTETDLKAILNPEVSSKDNLAHQQNATHKTHYTTHNDDSYSNASSSNKACDWINTKGNNSDKNNTSNSNSRVVPPSSLDVTPSRRSARSLQTSIMSNISGDESIGECSLDANLTASEPSLLSTSQHTTNGSQSQSNPSARYVHVPQSLVNSTATGDSILTSPGQDAGISVEVKLRRHHDRNGKDNNSSFSGSDSGPPSPSDPSHKPSYLKLACAVSGYGKYSRYSTYKDVNKPSPYSSQNSLRSGNTSPEPGMPAERNSGDEMSPHRVNNHSNSSSPGWRKTTANSNHTNGVDGAVNGHRNSQKYPTGDITKDGEYFLQHAQFEDDRLRGLANRSEAMMRSEDIPEEACGRIRSAIGKANLLLSQKFLQFRLLCQSHMQPDPEERETKWEDLQGFWDMIKIQVDNLDDMFAEIELMKTNGWQEIPRMPSRRSSASSSPKSANVSQASTPSATPAHTPGTKRKNLIVNKKDTPESSPERTQKARHAAKVRDEARRKMLAEKRAAMKQQQQQQQQQQQLASNGSAEVEIFLPGSSAATPTSDSSSSDKK